MFAILVQPQQHSMLVAPKEGGSSFSFSDGIGLDVPKYIEENCTVGGSEALMMCSCRSQVRSTQTLQPIAIRCSLNA